MKNVSIFFFSLLSITLFCYQLWGSACVMRNNRNRSKNSLTCLSFLTESEMGKKHANFKKWLQKMTDQWERDPNILTIVDLPDSVSMHIALWMKYRDRERERKNTHFSTPSEWMNKDWDASKRSVTLCLCCSQKIYYICQWWKLPMIIESMEERTKTNEKFRIR